MHNYSTSTEPDSKELPSTSNKPQQAPESPGTSRFIVNLSSVIAAAAADECQKRLAMHNQIATPFACAGCTNSSLGYISGLFL